MTTPVSSPPLSSPTTNRFLFLRPRSRSGTTSPQPSHAAQEESTGALRRAFSSSRTRSISISSPTTIATGRRQGDTSVSLPSTPLRESANPLDALPSTSTAPEATVAALRLVPHLDAMSRALTFEPIQRQLVAGAAPLRIGRYNEREESAPNSATFRSKVVSRTHAEIWAEADGRVLIRDRGSSSGSFLGGIRLSGPNAESRAFPLRDGDVLQLGVDYQGGTEAMYRCVKIRVELNRTWQQGVNAYKCGRLDIDSRR